jgi:hypothetical protein
MRLRFVDRLVELVPRASIRVEKCVSFEEAMLVRPSLGRGAPPTLLLEWLGQASQLLVAESTGYSRLALLGSFARAAFGPALPAGERARVEIDVRAWRHDAAVFDGRVAFADGRAALTVERTLCAFVPLDELADADDLRAAARAARGEFPGPVRA